MESQDLNIFHLIERNQKGVVVLVNKWDLIEKDNKTTINFEKRTAGKMALQRRGDHFHLGSHKTTSV